jgi:hypothetical protein
MGVTFFTVVLNVVMPDVILLSATLLNVVATKNRYLQWTPGNIKGTYTLKQKARVFVTKIN